MDIRPERIPGAGWLALLGGGELTFGETEDADRAWLARVPEGPRPIGFVPVASGSTEYGGHFAVYLKETFERTAETIPIYRSRDAQRGKNCERIAESSAVYLGGGVADHLLDTLKGSPAAEALEAHLVGGGVVVAITAAAQALGQVARSIFGGQLIDGLGWLPGGAVEPNFEPSHDRRLRQMLARPDVRWGLGIANGSAVLIGPEGEIEIVGEAYVLAEAEGELVALEE